MFVNLGFMCEDVIVMIKLDILSKVWRLCHEKKTYDVFFLYFALKNKSLH